MTVKGQGAGAVVKHLDKKGEALISPKGMTKYSKWLTGGLECSLPLIVPYSNQVVNVSEVKFEEDGGSL